MRGWRQEGVAGGGLVVLFREQAEIGMASMSGRIVEANVNAPSPRARFR